MDRIVGPQFNYTGSQHTHTRPRLPSLARARCGPYPVSRIYAHARSTRPKGGARRRLRPPGRSEPHLGSISAASRPCLGRSRGGGAARALLGRCALLRPLARRLEGVHDLRLRRSLEHLVIVLPARRLWPGRSKVKAGEIGDFGGSSLEHPRRWLDARPPGGWASPWECRAAQSRQLRPEKVQEPSWGAANKGVIATLLPMLSGRDMRMLSIRPPVLSPKTVPGRGNSQSR